MPEVAATLLWGVLIGVYRAWPQLCLTFVFAGLVFAAVTVVFLRSAQEPPGQRSGDRGGFVTLYLVLLPTPYGVLCALLALAAGLGVVLGWQWRRPRRSASIAVVVLRRGRLVWLTAAGVLWALGVAVGVALGSDRAGVLWIPLAPVPALVVALAVVTVGWGAMIGALREWAEVPAALGLGAAAVVAGIVVAGAVGPGFWGGTLANTAVTVVTAFGLLALALSLGVVAAGGVSSLTHRMRRRSTSASEDGLTQVVA